MLTLGFLCSVWGVSSPWSSSFGPCTRPAVCLCMSLHVPLCASLGHRSGPQRGRWRCCECSPTWRTSRLCRCSSNLWSMEEAWGEQGRLGAGGGWGLGAEGGWEGGGGGGGGGRGRGAVARAGEGVESQGIAQSDGLRHRGGLPRRPTPQALPLSVRQLSNRLLPLLVGAAATQHRESCAKAVCRETVGVLWASPSGPSPPDPREGGRGGGGSHGGGGRGRGGGRGKS
jgi:hypothetical protein